MIGRLPGATPSSREEAVVYTAHHDHLGARAGPAGRAGVYNGALDNASGVAALLAIAEAFAALPERPRRSILFASVDGRGVGAARARRTWPRTRRSPRDASPPTSTSTASTSGAAPATSR